MSQQASVGERGPRLPPSGYLSMEIRPLRRKGKGGEVPSFTARFLRLIEQRGVPVANQIRIYW